MTTNFASNSRLGKIDMEDDTNKPLLQRFGVVGFPTFKIFYFGVEILSGSSLISFSNAAGIVKYLITERVKEVSISICFLCAYFWPVNGG